LAANNPSGTPSGHDHPHDRAHDRAHDHGHDHGHDHPHPHEAPALAADAHDHGHDHPHPHEAPALAADAHDHGHDHPHPHPHGVAAGAAATAVAASGHGHGHGPGEDHGHTHGAVDPSILTTERGIWAVKWSFIALAITAIFQFVVVLFSQSVALLADTVHNIGDAATAIPLAIAFILARRKPSRQFGYGMNRAEDLAGIVVVGIILFSALYAGYESINRLLNPEPIGVLWAVALAGVVGFLGNEGVALFRIRVGKEINSAALIADGYHARADGFTSLAVVGGAAGAAIGFPILDPLVGLGITLAIFKIVWDSAKSVFTRALDGVDEEHLTEIEHAATHVPGVLSVTDVRARWAGHVLEAEISIGVAPETTVEKAHEISLAAAAEVKEHMPFVRHVAVHVDPSTRLGQANHVLSPSASA
jgi:cation diffusion facilitator family transporter